jgi:hypothetical protein
MEKPLSGAALTAGKSPEGFRSKIERSRRVADKFFYNKPFKY